jgi:hypothetical protein
MHTSLINDIMSIIKSIDISAWITALATIILAILTFIYVRLTGKILEANSDPCVILSVIHDSNRPTFLQLVAKNIGVGLAQDISFEFSRPIPARAFGLSVEKAEVAEVMTDGSIIDGIPALGPGEERKIDWGQYGGLIKNLGLEPVIVKCHFKKRGKIMPPVECKLDVKSFAKTVAVRPPDAQLAKEIEKISRTLNHLASGFSKLKVQVIEMPCFKNEESKHDNT